MPGVDRNGDRASESQAFFERPDREACPGTQFVILTYCIYYSVWHYKENILYY